MLLLTINRKPYMASPMALSHLILTDLEGSKSRSLRFSVVGGYLYGIDIIASSNITTIWMSQKGVCWRAGFSAVPAVFLVAIMTTALPWQPMDPPQWCHVLVGWGEYELCTSKTHLETKTSSALVHVS